MITQLLFVTSIGVATPLAVFENQKDCQAELVKMPVKLTLPNDVLYTCQSFPHGKEKRQVFIQDMKWFNELKKQQFNPKDL